MNVPVFESDTLLFQMPLTTLLLTIEFLPEFELYPDVSTEVLIDALVRLPEFPGTNLVLILIGLVMMSRWADFSIDFSIRLFFKDDDCKFLESELLIVDSSVVLSLV